MGKFSWITQDDHTSIRNNVTDLRSTAFMHDNKGNVWEESGYDGYGNFGGKDFFQLVAEMNNCEGLTGNSNEDRHIGINLVFSKKPYISPNLTRKKEWTWINKAPEMCPNQGWDDLE